METISAIILGIVQGLGEFLPISSKGHLILVQRLFGFKEHDLAYDLILHLATLLAIFIIFRKFFIYGICEAIRSVRKKQTNPSLRAVLLVAVGTVPAGIVGLLFKKNFESLYNSMDWLSFGFIFTGILLFLTRKTKGTSIDLKSDDAVGLIEELSQVSFEKAFLIGCFQVLALLPGVSRSGTTIAGGLFLGLSGSVASVFSFMISVPTIIGAAVLKLSETHVSEGRLVEYSIGFCFSFIFGLLGLHFLLKMVRRRKLEYFSYYVWILALFCIIALR